MVLSYLVNSFVGFSQPNNFGTLLLGLCWVTLSLNPTYNYHFNQVTGATPRGQVTGNREQGTANKTRKILFSGVDKGFKICYGYLDKEELS